MSEKISVSKDGVMQEKDSVIVLNLADIVEDNGKTVRQNNLERKHNISLYSLVEVCDIGVGDGLRLFVQDHTRDCDGTPMYSLTLDWEVVGEEVGSQKWKKVRQSLSGDEIEFKLALINCFSEEGKVSTGYSEDCLKVIKTGEDVRRGLIEKGYLSKTGEKL